MMETMRLFDNEEQMGLIVPTKMTWTREIITPKVAEAYLATSRGNRAISRGTVTAYANDIISGRWHTETSDGIALDVNGHLVNGHHRLLAIIKAGRPVETWVCRGVASDGLYDNVRKRSIRDQLTFMYGELFEPVYKNPLTLAVLKQLIIHKGTMSEQRTVTPDEYGEYILNNKEILDKYFLFIPTGSVPKVSITSVHVGMYLAYVNGVEIERIKEFYSILTTGMSVDPRAFPVLAYRNHLIGCEHTATATIEPISRCQFALYKYLTGSCYKGSKTMKQLKWDFPRA